MSNKQKPKLMKQCFRMFAMLLLATLAGTSAWAQGIEVPLPSFQPLQAGDTVYIYNIGTQKLVGWGEGWGTQAIVNDTGLRYVLKNKRDDGAMITINDEEFESLPEGQYWLYSPDVLDKAGHSIDRWDDGGKVGSGIKCCFADQSDWDTRGIWVITSVGNNLYKFTMPEGLPDFTEMQNQYVEGECLGVQLDHQTNQGQPTYGLYFDVVYADNPTFCQFAFLPAQAMSAYLLKKDLAKLVEEADALGIDASEARAIIANPDATEEEVQAVYDTLYVTLKEADQYNHPEDITEQYIVNWNPVSNTNGWETPKGQPNAFDAGNNNAEFWNLSGYSLRQTIHNLPAGVYMLRAIAMTRTDYESILAAGDVSMKIATVGAGEVNSRAQANAWFNAGNGVNDLTFVQEAEGDVEISLTADSQTGDHWTVWRSFQLFFRGDNADAIGKAAQALTENWEEEFVDAIYNQAYYDAVTEGIAASEAATTSEAALAAYVATRNALTALRANVDAYEALKARTEHIYEIIWDELDGDDILLAMIEGGEAYGVDYGAGILAEIEDGTLTTEQAVTKLQELNDRVDEVNRNLMQPGDDVTEKFVENYTFRNATGTASGFDKWTVDSDDALQNNAGSIQVVEQWNSNAGTSVIDVYQYVRLARGAYRLSTKGWYRSTTDYNTYKTNPDYQTVKSYLYGSASQFPFPDIYVKKYTADEKAEYFPNGNEYHFTEDGETYYCPNNCTGAEELFNNENIDCYDMYVDFIATGEPVKIGIKGTVLGYAWTIWDDFKLTFLGKDVDDMLPVAQASIDEAKAMLAQPMSNEARANLNAAIAAAEGATEGNALIDAYVELGKVKDATQASINAYNRLKVENEGLASAIIEYAETATDEAIATANALNAEIEEGLAAGIYTDAQIDEKIAEIAEALVGLKNPKGEGSDVNPLDYTARIINPLFTNGKTGWTEAEEFAGKVTVEQETTSLGTQIGFAEGWNTSFDIYQDINRLPEGTYRVRVQGLYRQEGTDPDAKNWKYGYAEKNGLLDLLTDEEKENVIDFDPRAKIYANGDTIDFTRWIFLPDNADDAATLQSGISDQGSWTAFEDNLTDPNAPVTYFYPNNRLALANRCDYGWYDNELYTYVDGSGVLRIGACNKTAKTLDWVPFSNWRLEYLGTESSHESTTGVREVVESEVTSKTIYTADGRRVNSMVKGLNIIKTTDKNGKTIVKKVIVK